MQVTEERFRALARSSPWRWQTLRFTLVRRPAREPIGDGVRAWLRRPGLLRVEDLDGNLVSVVREQPRKVALLTTDGGWAVPERDPLSTTPARDEDGFVVERPAMLDCDAPMFQDYHWVAMLDPVELTDGHDGRPGTRIRELEEVDHHGRRAWQAVIDAIDGYAPRCPCCALLPSLQSDGKEGGPSLLEFDPGFRYAHSHLVRIDVETGVCVYAEQQGGGNDGHWHQVKIEAVDEPMDDELFPVEKRPGWKVWRR
ncbi:MAG TPA: hypothetical protein VK906_04430 [Egicoccus sp.]|nr:hypothetical protein [Egicoccus sp.]HSK22395.1 hypothetical protein [Egicoccus sp.]